MQLIVTDNAFQRVSELINQTPDSPKILRVSVDGGGCNGFMYKYELTSEIFEDDYIIEKNGIKVIVDSISHPFLSGCILDFVEQLGSSYFEVKNPNAKANCGCGNSFSI